MTGEQIVAAISLVVLAAWGVVVIRSAWRQGR